MKSPRAWRRPVAPAVSSPGRPLHRSLVPARLALVLFLVGGATVMAAAPSGAASTSPTPASAVILHDISSIPASEFNAIGASSIAPPVHVKGQLVLRTNAKPEVFYAGAEFCPYCAAERWSLAIALLRFGTFQGLSTIASSSSDIYPKTATLDFLGAVFTSPYVNFTAVELENVNHQPLMSLSKSQTTLVNKYDTPKFVPGITAGSIPFVDFGNRFLQVGSSFSPALLAGLKAAKIASNLSDHSNAVTQSILATSNQLTADICSLTKQVPQKVCLSPGVESADSKQGLAH